MLRFDVRTRRFVDVFASNAKVSDLHRPDGLVFDSDGKLWITSFRNNADANDVDKILKLDGRTGRLFDKFPLWKPGQTRAYARAILFGPGGKLYIPITRVPPEMAGQIRRCDPRTNACDVIVQAGGVLQSPWFLIFRNTDPSTLIYDGQR